MTKRILKYPIWSCLGFDIYLLKFPKKQFVDDHLDAVSNKRHFRFNLTIYGNWKLFRHGIVDQQGCGSFHIFRPDIVPHAAQFQTNCLVLSIGWVLKLNKAEV